MGRKKDSPPEPPPCVFNRKVKAALQHRGLLQKQLGELLGETEFEFSKTLKRSTLPWKDIVQVQRIAGYLKVPLDWLVDDDPDLTVPEPRPDWDLHLSRDEATLIETMRFMGLSVDDVRRLLATTARVRDLGVPPEDAQTPPRRRGANNDR